MNNCSALICEFIPIGHIGQPQDIVAVTLLLASDKPRFMAAQCMVVDNGQRTATADNG
ncbi:SDR family oxidoreductase [Paenibacillus baekrokdamisoli]|uniref:SDR family oxidoreductase n=1 Tax=Paenibacillus baekrokdamisoli TaxID=1712516 RepID=UPI0035D4A220